MVSGVMIPFLHIFIYLPWEGGSPDISASISTPMTFALRACSALRLTEPPLILLSINH